VEQLRSDEMVKAYQTAIPTATGRVRKLEVRPDQFLLSAGVSAGSVGDCGGLPPLPPPLFFVPSLSPMFYGVFSHLGQAGWP
jgi:hypothetical protein